MHPCGSCGCNSQQGATVVAFISTGHFIMQLIIMCIFGRDTEDSNGHIHSDIEETEKIQIGVASDAGYYGLIATQVLMIFMSILLFVGVRYFSICMILPWIVTTAVADIAYFSFVVGTFIMTITKYNVLYLTAFIGSSFLFGVITYLLWVVIYFLLDLLKLPASRDTYERFGGESSTKSHASSSKGSSKLATMLNRDMKETPVKKYLLRDSDN